MNSGVRSTRAESELCINLTLFRTREKGHGVDQELGPEITIDLNSDTFVLSDSENIREQLRSQVELRVQSEISAYGTVDGGIIPDVFIQVVQDVLPLTQIYINILSSALYDLLTAARSRQGRGGSEGVFEAWATDSHGEPTIRARVVTDDPEIIKDLFRQVNEAASGFPGAD